MVVAGLENRGRTEDVETDGCWHQLKKPESDTNGPEERQRGTAPTLPPPSGPDTAQPAAGKKTWI